MCAASFPNGKPRKTALLIGINAYQKSPLDNCVNDANDLGKALRDIGFVTTIKHNLSCEAMNNEIEGFAKSVEADDLVVFFFSGHGVQHKNENYLIPSDDHRIQNMDDLKYRSVSAQRTLELICDKNPFFIVCFLDCCRTYDLPSTYKMKGDRPRSNGMAAMAAGKGVIIAYACAPNTIAQDGSSNGRNGVFTNHLIQNIKHNHEIVTVLRNVGIGVDRDTNGGQYPQVILGIMSGDVYLASTPEGVTQSNLTSVNIMSAEDGNACNGNQQNLFTTKKPSHDNNNVNPETTQKNDSASSECQSVLNNDTSVVIDTIRWQQVGVTVAGVNGKGANNDQLSEPLGLRVVDDDSEIIYVVDQGNHRIIECTNGDTAGRIVAGGKGPGKLLNQLLHSRDVLVDKVTNTLIIADGERIVQWSLRSNTAAGVVLLQNINCSGLALDDRRNLYVSDMVNHEVRRYDIDRGDRKGTCIAGGNGEGSNLNQLKVPTFLFIDQYQSLYVCDSLNHRVVKWNKGANQGIVVAGGKGQGRALTQLHHPNGIFVDPSGTLYVADGGNNRVICWPKGSTEGTVVVGARNGVGRIETSDQLNWPVGLSFDSNGNLFVVDRNNHRVQKFPVDESTD